MTNQINIEEKQIGKNWGIFKKVHQIITSDKKIAFRVFPIYVKYFIDEKVLAIIFFKGSFVDETCIDLGLNLKEKVAVKGLRDAKYMKDRNATYSILVREDGFDKAEIKSLIALTK